jgi:hypothetical protein
MTDHDRAVDLTWRDLADAECSHDRDRAQHDVDELRRLGVWVPEQRERE